jgi:hypothetical protein
LLLLLLLEGFEEVLPLSLQLLAIKLKKSEFARGRKKKVLVDEVLVRCQVGFAFPES